MATTNDDLSKSTICMVYVLLSITTSLTIASSYLYQIPILISLTIIILHLLTCDLSGGLLSNLQLFRSMTNFGEKMLTKHRHTLANHLQAEKTKNLQNMKSVSEQEFKEVLQAGEESLGVYTYVKDEEFEAAKFSSCNPSSGVPMACACSASKKVAYNKIRILEKLEKLPYMERQIWNPKTALDLTKQAAIASVLTEDVVCQESISTTADGDFEYVYVQCDKGESEQEQKIAALSAEMAQIESEIQEYGMDHAILLSECEKAQAKYDELVDRSKPTDQINLWLALYSAIDLVTQSEHKMLINGQRARCLSFDKHALELESWMEEATATTHGSIATFLYVKHAIAELSSPIEYQSSFLDALDERYARLLEEKPVLVEKEERAQQRLKLLRNLNDWQVVQLKPNSIDPLHKGNWVMTELKNIEKELDIASGLVIDNRWDIYTHRTALERLKIFTQQIEDIN